MEDMCPTIPRTNSRLPNTEPRPPPNVKGAGRPDHRGCHAGRHAVPCSPILWALVPIPHCPLPRCPIPTAQFPNTLLSWDRVLFPTVPLCPPSGGTGPTTNSEIGRQKSEQCRPALMHRHRTKARYKGGNIEEQALHRKA